MNIEDRLRDAGCARIDLVPPPRPLVLPDAPPEGTGLGAPSGPHAGRHWSGWLIPLTAAAAVIAIAGVLVAVKGTPGTGSASHSASAAASAPSTQTSSSSTGTHNGIPPYYVTLTYNTVSTKTSTVVLADTHTGKALATFKPPFLIEAADSAGDNTFVLYGTPWAKDGKNEEVAWYVLRVPPGAPSKATLTRLSLAVSFVAGDAEDAAVSPDGRTLAVFAPGAPHATALWTFSLTTGQVLRSWTLEAGSLQLNNMQWLADGHTLEFSDQDNGRTQFRDFNTDAPGGSNLIADSRLLGSLPASPTEFSSACADRALTADGESFICNTFASSTNKRAQACRAGVPALTSYSVATGKLEHVLYRYQGSCLQGNTETLWAASGSFAIGYADAVTSDGTHKKSTKLVGVMTPTTFTPLPITVPQSETVGSVLVFL